MSTGQKDWADEEALEEGKRILALNPKTGAGSQKVPLQFLLPVALAYESAAMEYGALKYGQTNFRDAPVPESTYTGAIFRHLMALLDGEDIDPDSGLPHLAMIRAGAGILLDAEACGTLIKDRATPGKASEIYRTIQVALPDLRAKWEVQRKAKYEGEDLK